MSSHLRQSFDSMVRPGSEAVGATVMNPMSACSPVPASFSPAAAKVPIREAPGAVGRRARQVGGILHLKGGGEATSSHVLWRGRRQAPNEPGSGEPAGRYS